MVPALDLGPAGLYVELVVLDSDKRPLLLVTAECNVDKTQAMRTQPRARLSWSSGKDSAMALAAARTAGDVEVTALLTTVNAAADRVAMHAVRRDLLRA